jgi:hypothetical protein
MLTAWQYMMTAAASALTGRATDPRDYVSEPITTGAAGVV